MPTPDDAPAKPATAEPETVAPFKGAVMLTAGSAMTADET